MEHFSSKNLPNLTQNPFRPQLRLKLAVLASFTLLLAITSYANAALKVGIVFDRGGKDDKSFNASAYKGVLEAEKQLKIELKYVEAQDDNAFESLLRAFAKKKFDLIIGVGMSQAEAIKKVAPQFPEAHFAIVDAEVAAPNVRSLLFEEHEGSYLVGAIAALTSKTGKVGFIGGVDCPLIRRFELGYKEGAKKANPKVEISSNFVGVTSEAWNNPPKAKELAIAQYQSGVDVIFAAAGASGSGLFDAAEEKKKFAIGVDSNQNWVKPGLILTSMLKRVDEAVFLTCKDAVEGHFTPGIVRYGLPNNGVGYALDENNKKVLTADVIKKVEALKSDIIAKKIVVSDFYTIKK